MEKSPVRKCFINIGTDTNSKWSSTKLSVDEVMALISRSGQL